MDKELATHRWMVHRDRPSALWWQWRLTFHHPKSANKNSFFKFYCIWFYLHTIIVHYRGVSISHENSAEISVAQSHRYWLMLSNVIMWSNFFFLALVVRSFPAWWRWIRPQEASSGTEGWGCSVRHRLDVLGHSWQRHAVNGSFRSGVQRCSNFTVRLQDAIFVIQWVKRCVPGDSVQVFDRESRQVGQLRQTLRKGASESCGKK